MLNVLASEIEDIVISTGNISLPQIVVTIANVILLAVNVILAIIKKIKRAKNNKQIQEVETSAGSLTLNKKKELNKDMEHLAKIRAVICKEKFENEYENVSAAEGTDLGSVLNNVISDMPETEIDASTIKTLLTSDYINAIARCYANTNNNKTLSGMGAMLGAFGYKLLITTEREEEVITVVKKEETLL